MGYESFDHLQKITQLKTNEYVIVPISFEVFKKTSLEKEQLKIEKLKHRNILRSHYGSNWKKFQNAG